ncbi:MAG: class I SAM-dependent methyltransferase [Pseudomonadota bacterium]
MFLTGPRWRRFWLGLQTLLGWAEKGYFIPYRHAGASIAPDRYPALEAHFAQAAPGFAGVLDDMADFEADLNALNGPPPRPRWDQDWFARLDGAAAYTLVRGHRPATIIEIGSGHSTRFMHAAVTDGGLSCAITSIDPQPRADIAALPITHHRCIVQDVDRSVFDALGPGDILFVDSSHILMPGSDVDIVVSDILPRLPAGVLLHFHDILLPDGYPPQWAWRGYNEQQGLAALIAGGGVELVFSSHYAATRLADVVRNSVAGALPLNEGVPETSLWLRKTAPGLGRLSNQ